MSWITGGNISTWANANPQGNFVDTFEYIVFDHLVQFVWYFRADNGAGTTDVTVTLPVAPVLNPNIVIACYGQTSVGTNQHSDVGAVITPSGIQFINFYACPEGQALSVLVYGWYPI